MKVDNLLPNRADFLRDLESWSWMNEDGDTSPEFNKLTAKLYSTIYTFSSYSNLVYFQGVIEDIELEERVTKLEGEVKTLRKDMAQLLKKFDELRNEIVISDKVKGNGFGQYH